jgi:hypothetical protein
MELMGKRTYNSELKYISYPHINFNRLQILTEALGK